MKRDELELLPEEPEKGEDGCMFGLLLLLDDENAEEEDEDEDPLDDVDDAEDEAECEEGSALGEARPLLPDGGGRNRDGENREAAAAWNTAAAAACCW